MICFGGQSFCGALENVFKVFPVVLARSLRRSFKALRSLGKIIGAILGDCFRDCLGLCFQIALGVLNKS